MTPYYKDDKDKMRTIKKLIKTTMYILLYPVKLIAFLVWAACGSVAITWARIKSVWVEFDF